jgi:spermidine/putrescine transport system permease protein
MKVVLPLSMPGVISGITMVFIPAITTFAISRLLGGGKYMLYGDLIENQFITLGLAGWNAGSALSFILLVLVVISMVIMRRAEREAGEEGGKLW